MREERAGYSFGPGRPGDIARLTEVDRAAGQLFAPTGLLTPEALDDTVPEDVLVAAMASGDLVTVRDAGGLAVGFALFSERGGGLYLDQVSVHPQHGKRGLGRALIGMVIEIARERDLPEITLSTFRDLPWNAPFYARLGFREIARADLEPFMLEIEESQRPFMDVAARCFMKRVVHSAAKEASDGS